MMNYERPGHAVDAPAGPLHAQTPIYFLAVDEEGLVQRSHLVYHLPLHHHRGTQGMVYLERGRAVQGIAAVEAGAGQPVMDGKEVEKAHQETRETKGPVLEGAVRVEQLARDHGCLRTGVEKSDQPRRGVPDDLGVRV